MITMEDWINGAKERFGYESWPRPPEKTARRIARQVSLDTGKMAKIWGLERRLPWGDHGHADYFEHKKNKEQRIMVRVTECRSHDDARMALLREISFSSAMTLPRLDARGITVGDIGFTGHDKVPTRIIFVRNNMLIDIRSIGNTPVSVEEFAKMADNYIIGIVQ